jgi:hypothetical protein
MPKFSAIVYATSDDEHRLEKTLDSLQVAQDVLLINADCVDNIRKLGRRFHARVKPGIPGVTPGAYLMDTYHPWILVVRPAEAVSDELRQSLEQWRHRKRDDNPGYRLAVLEKDDGQWIERKPELRLVDRRKINWTGELPPNADGPSLPGQLLRYSGKASAQMVA